MPAIDQRRHIDVEDVALGQHLLVGGNAVGDDMVHRNAAGVLVALIADRRRHGAVIAHEGFTQFVESGGGDAWAHMRADEIQCFGGKAPGPAHAVKPFRVMERNGAVIHIALGGKLHHEAYLRPITAKVNQV